MLGARIPLEWMTKYQELAAERGCKVAELAREALGQYLLTEGDSSDISAITSNSVLKIKSETNQVSIGDSSDIIDSTLILDLNARLEAIELFIGDSGDIKVVSQKLKLLENQLQELQNQVTALTREEQSVEIENKPVIVTEGWLTTGEAYAEAKRRGLTQSLGTFRRWLRDASEQEQLPIALQSLDIEADWASRKQGNPRDNSLRWLRFI